MMIGLCFLKDMIRGDVVWLSAWGDGSTIEKYVSVKNKIL
jgi:hypothetical protein